MNQEHTPREASLRAIEGRSALLPTPGGRMSAPWISRWLPALAKVGAAVLAAVVLAVVGAHAGSSPAPSDRAATASITTPVILAPPGPTSPSISGALGAADLSLADAGADPGPGVTPDGRVILNAATEDELTRLPGIGPTRARAIVALRQRLAKFRAVEDLLRVKGIGRKTLRRIKPSVILDRPATPDTKPTTD